MQFYDVIQSRTSVKKFKTTPIDKNKLSRMVNAAMMAPSWKNHTSYKFILVDDVGQKDQLSQCIMNATNDAMDAVIQAPMVAVVVANPAESGIIADRQYYQVDSGIAMEHFILAATNEGYGTCWIASIDEDRIRPILAIPDNFRVVAMTPIGEISENKSHYPQKDIGEYIYLNNWKNAWK